ncbi:MAG: hypothetical protein KDB00_00495, partial [Planctomycetales bacterium]|nr:hypothetical protein [Planctomycetales bacterium]
PQKHPISHLKKPQMSLGFRSMCLVFRGLTTSAGYVSPSGLAKIATSKRVSEGLKKSIFKPMFTVVGNVCVQKHRILLA